MILIADSGSTKCDWALIQSKEEIIEFNTMGFNPMFHSEEFITSTLLNSKEVIENKDKVDYIFYYGAGNSSKKMKDILERALQKVFTKAKHILSDHDLTGAALATYDGYPCISCILGTGSNSTYFDGDVAIEELPALGYILGDEGSGSYFGKKLLSNFIYGKLPGNINSAFIERYKLSKEEIFENVYAKPHANVYLASFMKFMSDFRDDPYIHELISTGFYEFLTTHVLCYKNARKVNIHFVGSVAYFFENELSKLALNLDLNIGVIIKKPIEGLIKYHIKNTLPKI